VRDSSDRRCTATIKAFGHLSRFIPNKKDEILLEFSEGTTVGELIDRAGIPRDEIWIVAVNDEIVEETTTVPHGARVVVMAPIEGG